MCPSVEFSRVHGERECTLQGGCSVTRGHLSQMVDLAAAAADPNGWELCRAYRSAAGPHQIWARAQSFEAVRAFLFMRTQFLWRLHPAVV